MDPYKRMDLLIERIEKEKITKLEARKQQRLKLKMSKNKSIKLF